MPDHQALEPPVEETPSTPAIRWLQDHGDALYQFAMARVGRPEVAEDAVQETLLAALGSKTGFSGQSSERTWLIGILKHKLIDHLRRSFRDAEGIDAEKDDALDFFDRRGRWKFKVGAWCGDPHQILENAEFRLVLAACLSKLPARTARVFWLREGEGMDCECLSHELKISATNVWTMLHRARLRLRRCLTINWFEGKNK